MDIDLLINAVREQKLLWNRKHKDYRNRLLSRRAWKCIADAFGCTSEEVQKKWKNLRDSFARELKKIPKCRSGAVTAGGRGEYRGDWPYFEAMKFLELVVKRRKRATSVPCLGGEADVFDDETIISVASASTELSGKADNLNEIKQEYDVDLIPHTSEVKFCIDQGSISPRPQTSSCQPDQSSAAEAGKIKRIRSETPFTKAFVDVGRENIELLKKDIDCQDDDDINWLKSILPYVKKLPPINKLLFRTNVQEMLLNELAKLESPTQTSGTKAEPAQNTIFLTILDETKRMRKSHAGHELSLYESAIKTLTKRHNEKSDKKASISSLLAAVYEQMY